MKLYPKISRAKLCFCGILAVLLFGGYYSFMWVAYNVPFIEFRAACKNYFRFPPRDNDDLHLISGDLTKEAWDALRTAFGGNFYKYIDNNMLTVKDNKVYVRLYFFFPNKTLPKFGGEIEEGAFFITSIAAFKIFQRRLSEGADFSDFMVTVGENGKPLSHPELMEPDECGFVEELILKGGRFAQDSSE
jgi:hypothetical protein